MTVFLAATLVRASYSECVDDAILLQIVRHITLADLVDCLKLSDLVSLQTTSEGRLLLASVRVQLQ